MKGWRLLNFNPLRHLHAAERSADILNLLNLGRAERPIVDPHIVNLATEVPGSAAVSMGADDRFRSQAAVGNAVRGRSGRRLDTVDVEFAVVGVVVDHCGEMMP